MNCVRTLSRSFWFAAIAFLAAGNLTAQDIRKQDLEKRKQRLEQEIREINRLLFAEQKQKGSVLDQMEAIEQKINRQQQLIRVTNQQSNLLNRQISTNARNIERLDRDLGQLKEDYANMIQKSYKNRSEQNYLLFLFSSDSWLQAYKRINYMKQYAQYRKSQGKEIIKKSDELVLLNQELSVQKQALEVLLAENRTVKEQLDAEVQIQRDLLKTIKQNEKVYAVEIASKQKEAKEIDNQIERLIRDAIRASNKNSDKSTAVAAERFSLTPEATLIASNFVANKGKLIWPVEKGVKKQGYGIYQDPIYPGLKHQSNGVIIASDEGAIARAVFEGEVIAILAVPGGNKGVQVKHGNYISTYYNLSEVYVKKGDKVSAKSALGRIGTNGFNGITQLKFYLYKDATRLNPEDWIYQL